MNICDMLNVSHLRIRLLMMGVGARTVTTAGEATKQGATSAPPGPKERYEASTENPAPAEELARSAALGATVAPMASRSARIPSRSRAACMRSLPGVTKNGTTACTPAFLACHRTVAANRSRRCASRTPIGRLSTLGDGRRLRERRGCSLTDVPNGRTDGHIYIYICEHVDRHSAALQTQCIG